jgi:hypothetical protein
MATKESTKSTLMEKHQSMNYRTLTQGRLTVTMLDDATTATRAALPPIYVAPHDVSRPALVEGFHLPNRFRVEGLDVPIEMEVNATEHDGVRVFACTSLVITSPVEADGIKDIPKIPLATLVKMAVKCARTLCMYYPPHYEGAQLNQKFRPIEGAALKVSERVHVAPLSASPPKGKTWTDEAINKLIGKPPRRPNNAVTDEELQKVADVYNNTKEAGGYPLAAVMEVFHYTKRTADNRVAQCKKQKLIPAPRKKATK